MIQKACKKCKLIYEGAAKCPNCESNENTPEFKGKVNILNPESSEIAQKLNVKKKGTYAIKLG